MKPFKLGCLDIGPTLILMNTSMCHVSGTRFNGTPSTSFQHPDLEDSEIVSLIEVSCAPITIKLCITKYPWFHYSCLIDIP